MNWIVASILMYVSSVLYYTGLRHYQKKSINNTLLNFISFSLYGFLIGGYCIAVGIPLDFPLPYFILTVIAFFFFSYTGLTFSLIGTQYAPNSGYSLIIQKSYAIFTSVASIFLFGSELTVKSVISIVIVMIFLGVMSFDSETKAHKSGKNWILYSFGAFFAFGALALFTKWLLNVGISVMSRTVYGAFIVSFFFAIELIYKVKTKKIDLKLNLTKFEYFGLILLGLFIGLFNLFMNVAYSMAPNVGYVNIINGGSITAITLLSAWIYKDKLTLQKIIGIIGVTGGLILLFI
jgi:drug/metabolite transporter (DMT)-like permease